MKSMSIHLRLAENDARERLEQMMGPYLNDLGAPAGFVYPHLDAYWKDASRYPYLIAHGNQLVGLALVHRVDDIPTHELVEFYIAAEFRKRGFGRESAGALFKLHRGRWSVAVRSDNRTGRAFWESVFAGCPSVTLAETTQPRGIVYTFTSREAAEAWEPISAEELDEVLSQQLKQCPPELAAPTMRHTGGRLSRGRLMIRGSCLCVQIKYELAGGPGNDTRPR